MKAFVSIGTCLLVFLLVSTSWAIPAPKQPVYSYHILYYEYVTNTWQTLPQLTFHTWIAAYRYAEPRFYHYRIQRRKCYPRWVVDFLAQ